MTLPIVKMGLNRPMDIEVTRVTSSFWEGLNQGEFRVVRCQACGRLSFPPRQVCPDCHARAFDWLPVCGRCKLYSVTRIHMSPAIYGILSPMRVAIVDLEEGIRIVTRMLPDGHSPEPDSALELVITQHPDGFHFAVRATTSE